MAKNIDKEIKRVKKEIAQLDADIKWSEQFRLSYQKKVDETTRKYADRPAARTRHLGALSGKLNQAVAIRKGEPGKRRSLQEELRSLEAEKGKR